MALEDRVSAVELADEREARLNIASEDSIAVYLQDIGVIPLLTASEEVELAKRIERGKKAEEILLHSTSPEERAAARLEKNEAVRARMKMIESNLRLVVSIARRYTGRGLPLSDLVEEGNLGLMRATDKFDYTRGYRFSTYATWWIRQAVTRALASQSRVVRLPVHVSEMVTQAAKATLKLSQELGREPTSEEIAREIHMNPDRVREIIKAAQQPISLEQPFGDTGDAFISEVIEDRNAEQPADRVSMDMLRDQVRSALRELTAREREVLMLRYGLTGDRYHTLEEVGREMGVTRERIRQIEKEALSKLRNRTGAESLRAFLG